MLAIELPDEERTLELAARLAGALEAEPGPIVITLRGPLGSGKTSFVRGLLRALGVTGAVRSPTYTLVEEHEAGRWTVLHLDLYRLGEKESLAEFGLRDRHVPGTLLLVEWPERAGPRALPPVDLAVNLELCGDYARAMELVAGSATGSRLLAALRGAEAAS